MKAPGSLCLGLAALLAVAGSCSRDRDAVLLTAPFNDDTEIGELSAVWKATGEERSFAEAARLKEKQVELRYRVDARNDMKDPVFLRLGEFRLLSRDGLAIGTDTRKIECLLAPGETREILSGSVWVAKREADGAARFTVQRTSVPLSERGRALYRQWLLERRPGEEKSIDAELAAYASVPPCTAPAPAAP